MSIEPERKTVVGTPVVLWKCNNLRAITISNSSIIQVESDCGCRLALAGSGAPGQWRLLEKRFAGEQFTFHLPAGPRRKVSSGPRARNFFLQAFGSRSAPVAKFNTHDRHRKQTLHQPPHALGPPSSRCQPVPAGASRCQPVPLHESQA